MGECSFSSGFVVYSIAIVYPAAVSQLKSFYLQVLKLLHWYVSALPPAFMLVTEALVIMFNACSLSTQFAALYPDMADVLVLLDGFGVLPTDTVRTINELLGGCN